MFDSIYIRIFNVNIIAQRPMSLPCAPNLDDIATLSVNVAIQKGDREKEKEKKIPNRKCHRNNEEKQVRKYIQRSIDTDMHNGNRSDEVTYKSIVYLYFVCVFVCGMWMRSGWFCLTWLLMYMCEI